MSTLGEGLRKRKRRYLNIPSDTIDDGNLSLKALGLLNVILNKPEGWVVRADAIARSRKPTDPEKKGKDGRDSVAAGLRELAQHGYYRVERRRLKDGTFKMGNAVSEEPVPSWVRDYKAYKGQPVPLVQQPDGSFKVLLPNGDLTEDGFEDPAFSQVAPVTAFPEPDEPDPAGPGSGGAGPGKAVPIVITEVATTERDINTPLTGSTASAPAHTHACTREEPPAQPQDGNPGENDDDTSWLVGLEGQKTKITTPIPPSTPGLTCENDPSETPSEPSLKDEAQVRRARAQAIGDRWVTWLDERGTPFPRSEPGVKFTEFAKFKTMIAKLLLNYGDGEIWDALVALYETRRRVKFPPPAQLESALDARRNPPPSREPWQRGGQAAGREPGAEVVVLDPARREQAQAVVEWYASQGPIDPEGRAELVGSVEQLLAGGATQRQVALALQHTGEPVPPLWKIRRFLWDPNGGAPKTKSQVRSEELADIKAAWDRDLAAMTGRPVPGDEPDWTVEETWTEPRFGPKTINGEVL